MIACCSAIALLVWGCATQKSREDQSELGKFYHNLTSKFNGYFNANELLEESIVQLEAQHQDNYNEILPVYPYREAPNPEQVASSLDEAIKKVSVVATLHENSDWVDDCYLLIGKAQYLKQDFESAQNSLEFFMDEFNPDGTRINARPSKKKDRAKTNRSKTATKSVNARKASKRKSAEAKAAEKARREYNKRVRKNQRSNKSSRSKDDSERKSADDIVLTKRNTTGPAEEVPKEEPKVETQGPENPGGLKHKPAHQEATLWLAKTYIERENYPRAEYHLNRLRAKSTLQEDVKRELPVVYAYYHMVRGNYQGAIPYLKEAMASARKKRDRARYAYIIAQISERESNASEAQQYYTDVLKLKPDYELDFNARLSLARTALASGKQSNAEVVASLEKMLKDDKNEEYKDQIHFTLGKLALASGNTPEAIRQLELAADHGGRSRTQDTETNYLLAQLYFDSGDYVAAKAAYDATLATMEKEDERYPQTLRLSKNLTDIAKHLSDIALQDSLLRVSAMSEEERRELAREILKERAALSSAESQDGNLPSGRTGKGISDSQFAASSQFAGTARRTSTGSSGGSNFFAYDERAVRRGKREFERVWGDRPLVDNWRLASRLEAAESLTETIQTDDGESVTIAPDDIESVFTNIPKTEAEISSAHAVIQNAMLQLGTLYREKLENYDLSVETLQQLLTRYPETLHRLDAYYQLYLSYISMNDMAKAEEYKNRIINEFSQSKYALALSDPDYINRQLSEEQLLDQYYQEVYQLVDEGAYEEAQNRINEAKQRFGTTHALQPKFAILEAMCTGHIEGREAYIGALRAIVGTYPNTPEETKARDMLLLLGEYQGNRLNLARGNDASGPNFKPAPDAVHFMLVMVHNQDDEELNTRDLKISVSE
ncbi:MAG: tetratricopeptide repeat protein, partial [Saprospiraceae bacterium]|nr:tetratricopeptide repeat protein [Saprospiraceae bacterium]